jgi:hypothetical protein
VGFGERGVRNRRVCKEGSCRVLFGVRSGRAWHVRKTSARRLQYAAPGLNLAAAVRRSSDSVYRAMWAGKLRWMRPEQIQPVEIGWAETVWISVGKISGSIEAGQTT